MVSTSNELADLDDYSLLNIFDWLNLTDFLHLAQLNQRYEKLVIDHYLIGKYHFHENRLALNAINSKLQIVDGIQIESIVGNDEVLQFIRHFGPAIHHLDIYSRHNTDNEMANLGKFIEFYCRDSLASLSLTYEASSLLNQWTMQFSNVQNFSISIIQNPHKLREIFPMMRNLSVTVLNDLSINSLHLPNLYHLSYHEFVSSPKKIFLQNIIQSNEQLKSFESDIPMNLDTLQLISKYSTELEFLNLRCIFLNSIIPINSSTVRFPKVKQFSFVSQSTAMLSHPFPIVFDRLESLELYEQKLSTPLISFIIQNKQLTFVSLPCCSLTYDQLNKLVDELPKLQAINVKWPNNMTSIDFFNIIDKSEQMEYLTIILNDDNDNNDLLMEKIPTEWELQNSDLDLMNNKLKFQRSKELESII